MQISGYSSKVWGNLYFPLSLKPNFPVGKRCGCAMCRCSRSYTGCFPSSGVLTTGFSIPVAARVSATNVVLNWAIGSSKPLPLSGISTVILTGSFYDRSKSNTCYYCYCYRHQHYYRHSSHCLNLANLL